MYNLSKLKELVSSIVSTTTYCMSLSWKASRLYTLVRLIGRVITPLSAILSAFISKYLIDLLSGAWVPADKMKTLLILLVSTLFLALINAMIRKGTQYCQTMHSEILGKQLSMTIMDKALDVDIEFFDNPAYHNKLMAASRDSHSFVNVLWNVIEHISAYISFVGAFFVLSSSNILYGVAVVLAAFPSAIAGAKYTKSLYKLSLDQLKGERRKAYLQGLTTSRQFSQEIRLFNVGDFLKKRYERLWENLFTERKKMLRKRSIITGVLECLPEITMIGIAVDVSIRVLSGLAIVGDYMLYTGLAAQLSGSIFILTSTAIQIYDDKLHISNFKSLSEFSNRVKNLGTRVLEDVRTIEFTDVDFAYPGTENNVLENVSFSIGESEKVALVGVNGSGKTTLIKLLLRYYDVDSGSIKINGIDIREYELYSLRRCFSVYFQDMPNYNFTLRENITLADRERNKDDSSIVKALEDSDATDVLRRVRNGLDTYLSRMFEDEGVELSGGQIQKIALARAFYRRHSALILDEPSSNLDPEAEHRVFESLRLLCRGKTTLFTSHRLSNIVLADRVVVLENGRIIEQGTHDELLHKKHRYAELYKYQHDKYRESTVC